MKNKSIKQQLDDLLAKNPQEQIDFDAQMLTFQFLSRVDAAMADQGMSKKHLASSIGTSPAFITQLFRGDRKPNWSILAKMQKELGLKFRVLDGSELNELVRDEMLDYHRKWVKSRKYEARKGMDASEAIMSIEDDYALAG